MKESKLHIPSVAKISICTHCIICDEPIELTSMEEMHLSYGKNINAKVCDKCKQAIMRLRNWIENGEYPVIQGDIVAEISDTDMEEVSNAQSM